MTISVRSVANILLCAALLALFFFFGKPRLIGQATQAPPPAPEAGYPIASAIPAEPDG
jgi:hypothetical protein